MTRHLLGSRLGSMGKRGLIVPDFIPLWAISVLLQSGLKNPQFRVDSGQIVVNITSNHN